MMLLLVPPFVCAPPVCCMGSSNATFGAEFIVDIDIGFILEFPSERSLALLLEEFAFIFMGAAWAYGFIMCAGGAADENQSDSSLPRSEYEFLPLLLSTDLLAPY